MSTAIREFSAWKYGNRLSDSLYGLVRLLPKPVAQLLNALGITANQVSVCRLICAPLSFYLLNNFKQPLWEYCIVILLWAYSDGVDGVMSKDPGMENKPEDDIGSVIDPQADKATIGALYLFQYNNFPQIVVLTLIGESIIVVLSACSLALAHLQGESVRAVIKKMRASYWGKFKFVLETTSALLMVWYAASPSRGLETIVVITSTAAIFLMIMSLMAKVKKVLG